MFDFIKKTKLYSIFACIIFIAIGILIMINPNESLFFAAELMGAAIFVAGAGLAVSSLMQGGSFLPIVGGVIALSGIFVVIYPAVIIGFVISFIGIAVFVHAFYEMRKAAEARELGYAGWHILMISGSIKAVCALVVIFVPFFASELVLRIVGVVVIFEASTYMINILKFFKDIDAMKLEAESDDIIDV